jgi:hypothetical protein
LDSRLNCIVTALFYEDEDATNDREHLLAGQEHSMTMLNAYHERMMACLEKMEANGFEGGI